MILNEARPEPSGLRLLVAMPALNEEQSIADVIRRVPGEIDGISAIEILVVDDGSADRTVEIAEQLGVHIIRHRNQRGVGAAFQTALAEGIDRGVDLIVSIDSDGQFAPEDIPHLIRPVLEGRADFTTASRFMDKNLVPEMSKVKYWGNLAMSHVISRLAGRRFYDVSCGMRCYSIRAALQLHLVGHFTYTQEVFLNLAFKHMRIVEVPIKVRGVREFGKSRVASNLFDYGWRTLKIIFRCYRDYRPLRFFVSAAAMSLLLSIGFLSYFLQHYWKTGAFRPNTWAAVLAGGFGLIALAMIHIGMVGDMLNRHRIYLEEILYRLRRGSNDHRPR